MATMTRAGAFRIALPACTAFSTDYPPGKWHPAAMNATRTSPPGLPPLPAGPAVYCFEFHQTPLKWYVGETGRFASRMRDYAEMTRLLLALLQFKGQVTIQKHAFRSAQMELADAMVAGTQVTLWYRTLATGCGKVVLKNEETAERVSMRHRHPSSIEINDGPSLEQMATIRLAPHWRPIQARVRKRNLV